MFPGSLILQKKFVLSASTVLNSFLMDMFVKSLSPVLKCNVVLASQVGFFKSLTIPHFDRD